jgi:hypothetical protein
MYHLLSQSVTLYFVFVGFMRFSAQTEITSLNSVNKFVVVMVKCGDLFEVRAEFLIFYLDELQLQWVNIII